MCPLSSRQPERPDRVADEFGVLDPGRPAYWSQGRYLLPLPMPVVLTTTHPDGTSSRRIDTVFAVTCHQAAAMKTATESEGYEGPDAFVARGHDRWPSQRVCPPARWGPD